LIQINNIYSLIIKNLGPMEGKHSSSQRAIFLNPMIGSDTEIP